MIVPLKKTLKKDGQEITSLNLDFDSLTGLQIAEAEQEARLAGNRTLTPLHTTHGQAFVAAKACGMIPDDIFKLGASDFLNVTGLVFIFLNDGDLPEMKKESTEAKEKIPHSTDSESKS